MFFNTLHLLQNKFNWFLIWCVNSDLSLIHPRPKSDHKVLTKQQENVRSIRAIPIHWPQLMGRWYSYMFIKTLFKVTDDDHHHPPPPPSSLHGPLQELILSLCPSLLLLLLLSSFGPRRDVNDWLGSLYLYYVPACPEIMWNVKTARDHFLRLCLPSLALSRGPSALAASSSSLKALRLRDDGGI